MVMNGLVRPCGTCFVPPFLSTGAIPWRRTIPRWWGVEDCCGNYLSGLDYSPLEGEGVERGRQAGWLAGGGHLWSKRIMPPRLRQRRPRPWGRRTTSITARCLLCLSCIAAVVVVRVGAFLPPPPPPIDPSSSSAAAPPPPPSPSRPLSPSSPPLQAATLDKAG